MPKKRSYPEVREIIFSKTNGHCAYCGCNLSFYNFHIDHVIPKRRYLHPEYKSITKKGTDDERNLMPSCSSCNSCKSDLSVGAFRARIEDRIHRLNNYSSEYIIAKRFGLVIEVDSPIVFYFEQMMEGVNQ